MKRFSLGLALISSVVAPACFFSNAQAQSGTFSGTVERVWEDGFRLNTGDRTLRVDSWDLYGDSTARFITEGDQLIVSGEFDGRDFDAFSITQSDGSAVEASSSSSAAGTTYTGTVEQVWEDGFRLNTGDRTFRVDSWGVCRDFTARHVAVGDRVSVSGEFDGGEFDAFSIVDSADAAVCR